MPPTLDLEAIAAADSTPALRLRRFVLRALAVQAFCIAIATLLWSFRHDHFFGSLLYSMVIGNISWLSIDFGLHLVAPLMRPAGASALGNKRWPGVPGMVIVVALGSLTGYTAGTALIDAVMGWRTPGLFANKVAGVTTLLAAVAMTFYFYSRERMRLQALAAEAALRVATENQLKLLESQLEPHMLFNTLANLRVLIGIDPPRAQAMLDRLIAFLRATLNASRSDSHRLAAEFDRLADYLALMEVRMGARLAVRFELPAALREQPVPPLLLQPLVENAIKHGLEPKVEGGRIDISARAEAGQLWLEVRDTGIGLAAAAGATGKPAAADNTSYGTRHVHERLKALYGERARFTLTEAGAPDGGARATLVMPLQPVPTA